MLQYNLRSHKFYGLLPFVQWIITVPHPAGDFVVKGFSNTSTKCVVFKRDFFAVRPHNFLQHTAAIPFIAPYFSLGFYLASQVSFRIVFITGGAFVVVNSQKLTSGAVFTVLLRQGFKEIADGIRHAHFKTIVAVARGNEASEGIVRKNGF